MPGTGTLEIQGKNATVALKALTATTAVSTLKFTLAADGVSSITVNDALTVTNSTKLVVDMTAYNTANGLTVDLISYGSKFCAYDDNR